MDADNLTFQRQMSIFFRLPISIEVGIFHVLAEGTPERGCLRMGDKPKIESVDRDLNIPGVAPDM